MSEVFPGGISGEQAAAPEENNRKGKARRRNAEQLCAAIAPWLLAGFAWLLATSFYFGDLGKWCDDYSNAYVDPVTGRNTHVLGFPGWHRPLHWIVGCWKATVLWNLDAANHWVGAVSHALVALAAWALLRVMVRRRALAAAGAILFLVFPFSYEVSLWPAAWSVMPALLLVMGGFGLTVYAARRGRIRWVCLPIFVLFFLSACWYELPAIGVAALPLLYLANSPRSFGWPARLKRAAILGAGACAGPALYLLLNVSTLPPGARTGTGMLVTQAEFPHRWRAFSDAFTWYFLGTGAREMLRGSMQIGWKSLTSGAGLGWSVAIVAALALWIRWCALRRGDPSVEPVGESARSIAYRPGALAFGLALFAMPWTIILLLQRQTVDYRLMYVPIIGLIVVLVVLLDMPLGLGWVRRLEGRVLRTLAGAALAALVLACCVSLIGIQTNLRNRFIRDQQEMSQLLRLEPDPPPAAVIVPLRCESRVSATGFRMFDDFAVGAFTISWAADSLVRYRYHRRDLAATGCLPGQAPPLRDFTAAGVRCTTAFGVYFGPLDPRGGLWLTWKQIIPIVVSREGHVQRVKRLTINRADGPSLVIDEFATSCSAIAPDDCVDFEIDGPVSR